MALNTQTAVASELIDLRVACHPVRLLADCEQHARLPQPLVTPLSMLPEEVRSALQGKQVLDYGLNVASEGFSFQERSCTAPTSLVMAYALAMAASGQARRIYLAGFDGYGADDPRSQEVKALLEQYEQAEDGVDLISIARSRYHIPATSVYAL